MQKSIRTHDMNNQGHGTIGFIKMYSFVAQNCFVMSSSLMTLRPIIFNDNPALCAWLAD